MDVRYFIDPETEAPHIYRHGVTEDDVEEVLQRPMEDRPGRARVWLWGEPKRGGIFESSMCLIQPPTRCSSSRPTRLAGGH